MTKMKNKRKYPLDMAGKYFAGIMTAKRRPLFAFVAVLAEPVDPLVLKQAVDQTLPRFPYYTVSLKQGLFWPYFQETEMNIKPTDNGGTPFKPIGKKDPLFRISYHDRKIYLEILHVLADGQGALTFMKTLLGQYFTTQGIRVPETHGLFSIDDEPDAEEYADTIHQYCQSSNFRSAKVSNAYCLAGHSSAAEHALIAMGIMKTQDVLDKAHAGDASLTEYLAAVLAQSLMMQQLAEKPRKLLPVTINISTDLRRYYASKTLRNFSFHDSLYIEPTGDLEPFAEVLARFCRQRRTFFSEKNLNDRIGEILRYFSLVRGIPYLIKKIAVMLVFWRIGDRTITAHLSNLGQVELPESIRDQVIRFETMGNNSRRSKIKCGVISYKDNLTVAFSSTLVHTDVQDRFFAMLAGDGIPVVHENNRPVAVCRNHLKQEILSDRPVN